MEYMESKMQDLIEGNIILHEEELALTHKKCWNCKRFLPIEKFTKSQRRPKNSAECQECCKARNKARYESRKDEYKANALDWIDRNREKWNEINRGHYHKDIEKSRAYQRDRYHRNKKK